MWQIGLDAYMQYADFLESLKANNPIVAVREQMKSLQSKVSELTEKNESKSQSLKKSKSKLVRAQVKRAEVKKLLAEEVEKSKLSQEVLRSKISELEGEIEKLKRGEGLDPFSLIDTPPFAEIQDVWDTLNLLKFRRALTKFHPSVDQSFLDKGIPDVEGDEETSEDNELEGDTEFEEDTEVESDAETGGWDEAGGGSKDGGGEELEKD